MSKLSLSLSREPTLERERDHKEALIDDTYGFYAYNNSFENIINHIGTEVVRYHKKNCTV